jgi:ribonuclease HIII
MVWTTILVVAVLAVPVGGSFTGSSSSMVMTSSQRRQFQSQSVEKSLHKRGFRYVIGSNEAGRGCIAGPVVVASCCLLTRESSTDGVVVVVDDSKNLSESERLRIFKEILTSPDRYA